MFNRDGPKIEFSSTRIFLEDWKSFTDIKDTIIFHNICFFIISNKVASISNYIYIYIEGESKKRCDLRRLVQNCTFFVQLSCMVFFQYFLKICKKFFGTPMPQKKSANLFFSQNQKFRKAKMCLIFISIKI